MRWILIVTCCLAVSGCAIVRELSEGSAYSGERNLQVGSFLYDEAFSLYEKGEYAAAKDLFHRYVNEFPDTSLYVISLYYLGICHHELGDLEEAKNIFNKIIGENPPTDFWVDYSHKRLALIEEEETRLYNEETEAKAQAFLEALNNE